VAAEVDLRIEILELKALGIAIHTYQGIEHDRGACEAEEHNGAERYEIRLGHIPQGHFCRTDVVYQTPHRDNGDGRDHGGH
jgi:hypothetical protein